MSEALLSWAAGNVLAATALAAVALVAGLVLRRWPAAVHALWALVLLKLLMPPLVGLPVWPRAQPEPSAPSEPDGCPAAVVAAQPAVAVGPADVSPPPAPFALSWADWLVLGWLVGTVLYWAVAGWRVARLYRLLARLPDADGGDWLAELAARLGLRRVPRVVLAPATMPPLLVAVVGRPVLVLPAALWARLDGAQRETLVLHELAHLARGDQHVRRLELVVLGLFWWLPTAWLAARALRHAEEQCCDAWVVWASPDHAPAYASVLVETLAFLAARPAALPEGASGAAPVVDLQRRLSMILLGKVPRRLSRPGLIVVGALALLLLPLAPSSAQPRLAEVPAVMSMEDFVARTKSCQACHVGKAKSPVGHGHDEIVRLMDELRRMKKQMKEKEDLLAEVLKKFEKSHAPPRPVEKDRLRELEQKLDALRKELDALRPKPKDAAPLPSAISEVVYINRRVFNVPIAFARKEGRGDVKLYVSADSGRTWQLHGRAGWFDTAIRFDAPADGHYWFALGINDEKPGPAQMKVCVDTVAPTVALTAEEHAGAVVLHWTVADPHLDLRTFVIEFRTREGGWKPAPIPGKSIGSTRLPIEGLRPRSWRVRVKDLAGNEGMTVATVTKSDLP